MGRELQPAGERGAFRSLNRQIHRDRRDDACARRCNRKSDFRKNADHLVPPNSDRHRDLDPNCNCNGDCDFDADSNSNCDRNSDGNRHCHRFKDTNRKGDRVPVAERIADRQARAKGVAHSNYHRDADHAGDDHCNLNSGRHHISTGLGHGDRVVVSRKRFTRRFERDYSLTSKATKNTRRCFKGSAGNRRKGIPSA